METEFLAKLPEVAWLPSFSLWGLLLARMTGLVLFLSLIPKTLGWRFRLALAVLLSWVLAASLANSTLDRDENRDLGDVLAEFLLGGGLGLGVSIVLAGVRLCAEILELPWSPGEMAGIDYWEGAGAGAMGSALSWLTAVIFVLGGGHLQVVIACRDMVRNFPPGCSPMLGGLVHLLAFSCQEATCLALRLAAPVWGASAIAMLVMAVLGRLFPVVSGVSAGFPWRAGVTWLALCLSMHSFAQILQQEIADLGSRVGVHGIGKPVLSDSPAAEVGE